jgi:hypothetical protein
MPKAIIQVKIISSLRDWGIPDHSLKTNKKRASSAIGFTSLRILIA